MKILIIVVKIKSWKSSIASYYNKFINYCCKVYFNYYYLEYFNLSFISFCLYYFQLFYLKMRNDMSSTFSQYFYNKF